MNDCFEIQMLYDSINYILIKRWRPSLYMHVDVDEEIAGLIQS